MGVCLCVGACACSAAVAYLVLRNCFLISDNKMSEMRLGGVDIISEDNEVVKSGCSY